MPNRHRCEGYIKVLEARLEFVKTVHKYLCKHDDSILGADIEKYRMDALKTKIEGLRKEIGHDPVDELLDRWDAVIEAVKAL